MNFFYCRHVLCKLNKNYACFAKGVLREDGTVLLYKEQNHPPEDYAFKRQLRENVENSTNNLRNIYNDMSLL